MISFTHPGGCCVAAADRIRPAATRSDCSNVAGTDRDHRGCRTAHAQQSRRTQHDDGADGRRRSSAAMEAFEADESVGAVVVTGAGSAFCAGANLGNLQTATRESLGNVYEGFLRIARSPLPTLAAVNGPAVGAGMNLALGCDVRIAATRAKLRHPVPADRPASRGRSHVDAASYRRPAGSDGGGGVQPGARRPRGRTGRPRLQVRARRRAARRRPCVCLGRGHGPARPGDPDQAHDSGHGRHRHPPRSGRRASSTHSSGPSSSRGSRSESRHSRRRSAARIRERRRPCDAATPESATHRDVWRAVVTRPRPSAEFAQNCYRSLCLRRVDGRLWCTQGEELHHPTRR